MSFHQSESIEPYSAGDKDPYGVKIIRFIQKIISMGLMLGMLVGFVGFLVIIMADIEGNDRPFLNQKLEWQGELAIPLHIVEQSDGDIVFVYLQGEITSHRFKYIHSDSDDTGEWESCAECGGELGLYAIEMTSNGEIISEAVIREWNINSTYWRQFAATDDEMVFTEWVWFGSKYIESAYSITNLDAPPTEWNVSLIEGVSGDSPTTGTVTWNQPIAFDEIVWVQNEFETGDIGVDSWYLLDVENGTRELLFSDETSITISYELNFPGEGAWEIVLQSDDEDSPDQWCDLSLDSNHCFKAPWEEERKVVEPDGKLGEFGWLLPLPNWPYDCQWFDSETGTERAVESDWEYTSNRKTCLSSYYGSIIIPDWERATIWVADPPESGGLWYNTFCWKNSGADCTIRWEIQVALL